jgi:hypothetical protein
MFFSLRRIDEKITKERTLFKIYILEFKRVEYKRQKNKNDTRKIENKIEVVSFLILSRYTLNIILIFQYAS